METKGSLAFSEATDKFAVLVADISQTNHRIRECFSRLFVIFVVKFDRRQAIDQRAGKEAGLIVMGKVDRRMNEMAVAREILKPAGRRHKRVAVGAVHKHQPWNPMGEEGSILVPPRATLGRRRKQRM